VNAAVKACDCPAVSVTVDDGVTVKVAAFNWTLALPETVESNVLVAVIVIFCVDGIGLGAV